MTTDGEHTVGPGCAVVGKRWVGGGRDVDTLGGCWRGEMRSKQTPAVEMTGPEQWQ